MARPRIYATEEERQAAKKASWQKYNLAHKSERAAHNKVDCQREDVKAKRRELHRVKKASNCKFHRQPQQSGQNLKRLIV